MITIHRFIESITREIVHREKVPIENALRALVATIFRAQARDVSADFIPKIDFLFREASVPNAVLSIVDAILIDKATGFQSDLAKLLLAALQKGSARVSTEMTIGADFRIPATTEAQIVRDQGARMIAGINNTTREMVREIIANGLEQHWSYQQVAALLRARFAEFTSLAGQGHIRDRAELIAIQEVGMAYVAGQVAQARTMASLGIDVQKKQLVVGDELTCPICLGNEAQGWIGLDDGFDSGGDPPSHVACRCALEIRQAK